MSKNKEIHQFTLDGTFVKTYKNTMEAARAVKCNEASLRKPLKHKSVVKRKGFLFSYCKDNGVNAIVDEIKLQLPQAKVLLLDIETSPMIAYVWKLWDNNVSKDQLIQDWFIISWSAKWLLEPEIMSSCLTPDEILERNDFRIVDQLWDLLDEADFVIGHYAKGFDIPKTNTRFLMHYMLPPSTYVVIDTKQAMVGGNFAFASNKLNFLADALELRHSKLKTEFELWDKCMHGDQESLNYMEKYNREDVLTLEDLYIRIRPWMKAHPNIGSFEIGNGKHCSVCGSTDLHLLGEYHATVNTYDSYRCMNCGGISRTTKSVKSFTKPEDRLVSTAH